MYVCYVERVCTEISSQLNKTLMATFEPAYAMFIVFLPLMFYLTICWSSSFDYCGIMSLNKCVTELYGEGYRYTLCV